MASRPPSPTTTVTNPRIAKLIELETRGVIKPEHEEELNVYRAQGLAPKKANTTLTQSQGQSTGFYARALSSNGLFNGTSAATEPRGPIAQSLAETFPTIANTMTGSDRQKAEQAKNDFIAATLRYESGAAIGKDEFSRQDQIFFPQPGDGAEVIAQKAKAREVAIAGLRESAGPGEQTAEKAAAGQSAPTVATPGAAPSATPPAPGVPPPDPGHPIRQTGDIGFNTPDTPKNPLSAEQQTAIDAWMKANPKATPEQLHAFGLSMGQDFQNADAIVKARDAGYGVRPASEAHLPTTPIDPGDGSAGALVRGVAEVIPGAKRIKAAVDTLRGDKSYNENFSDQQRIAAFDEENHPWMRTGGTLAGGIAGGFIFPGSEGATASEIAGTSAKLGVLYGVANTPDFTDIPGTIKSGVVGGLIGAGTGYGVGKLSDYYAGRLRAPPPPSTDAQNTFAAAQRQDIPILPQDVGGAGIGRATQGAAQTPFGAGTVSRAANKLYDRFMGRVGELAGNAPTRDEAGNIIGAHAQAAADQSATAAERTSGAVEGALGTPVDATGAGQLVQRGVSRWMDETGQRATGLYNDIPIAADREAVVSNTRAALADMTQGMSSNPQLSAMFKNGRLEGYMDALTPKAEVADGAVLPGGGRAQPQIQMTGGKLNWEDLSAFRTRVGDMLDDPRLTDDIATRQLRKLYGALSEDIKATAQAEGPEAFTKWKRANDYYDGRMKRINDTLSMVVGDKKDATPNEAMSALQSMIKEGRSGNAAAFSRVMRSIPAEDRDVVRASIVNDARGGKKFDPAAFAKAWGSMSERGKSALLPQDGMRALMDDAAMRASASDKNPFAGKSGEQIFETFDKMATNKGDRARFKATMDSLSPDEAAHVRSTYIDIMGRPPKDAREAGEADFSITRWVNRYNDMPATSKAAMFGTGDLRSALEDLATVAGKVKASERLAGHSNTGAVNSFNATTGGLGGAVLALFSGHPLVAAGLASPAAYQAISARVLTSPTLVRWLAGATRTSLSPQAYIERLGRIAVRSPSIAQDALGLQKMMMHAVNDNAPTVARAAASDAKGPDQQQQK